MNTRITNVLYAMIVIVCVVFAACNRVPDPTSPSVDQEPTQGVTTPIPPPTLSLPTTAPSSTHSPTFETAAPTPFVSMTPTNAVQPGITIKTQCLEIAPGLPSDPTFDGVLVLIWGLDGDALLNLKTGEKIPLPGKKFSLAAASPDGKWLAYTRLEYSSPELTITGGELLILDAKGQPQISIPWDASWIDEFWWLDNQHLMIVREGDPLDSLVVLDPFTGESQELLPDFPNIITLPPIPFTPVYDASLSRVVYMGWGEESSDLILYDLQSQGIVAKIKAYPNFTDPLWSPDGQHFAYATPINDWETDELLIVSRDGIVEQRINLSATYPHVLITHYSWSPDGRFIAFWLNPEQSTETKEYLAILDIEKQEVTDYCIPGGQQGLAPAPIWFPDGDQLVVNSYPDGVDRAIVIDLNQGTAAIAAEDVYPVGWMVGE